MSPVSDLIDDFIRRAESGARNAYKPLVEGLREKPDELPEVARLAEEGNPLVARCACAALGAFAEHDWRAVRPHASALVKAAGSEDARTREAALEALAALAGHAPTAAAEGLEVLREAFHARKPQVRASAALCLARIGLAPELRPQVLPEFVAHFRKNPRDKQAREILVAMSELAEAQDLAAEEREELAGAVAPLRAHPNLQVRERAGRLWRTLGAPPGP